MVAADELRIHSTSDTAFPFASKDAYRLQFAPGNAPNVSRMQTYAIVNRYAAYRMIGVHGECV
jgi:hypothetical protein